MKPSENVIVLPVQGQAAPQISTVKDGLWCQTQICTQTGATLQHGSTDPFPITVLVITFINISGHLNEWVSKHQRERNHMGPEHLEI